MPTALIKISLSIGTVWWGCSLSTDIFSRSNESVGRQQKPWYIRAETGRTHVHTWKGSFFHDKVQIFTVKGPVITDMRSSASIINSSFRLIDLVDWPETQTTIKITHLTLKLASKICSRRHFDFWNFFQRKEVHVLTFHVNHLLGRWFTWNVKTYFLLKKKKMPSAAVVIGTLRVI